MKQNSSICLAVFLPLFFVTPLEKATAQERHAVTSPNGELAISLTLGSEPTVAVEWRGRPLLMPSPIQLFVGPTGDPMLPTAGGRATESSNDAVLQPIVPEKRAEIRDRFNEIAVDFPSGWGMDLRAYDDGVAYRYRASAPGEREIRGERMSLRFPGDPLLWFPQEESFLTHQERQYRQLRLSELEAEAFASVPVLIAPDGMPKLLVTESDLRNYPGFYLQANGEGGLESLLPAYPAREEQVRDRTVRVVEREEYIARTQGPRTLPWRVFIVAEEDRALVENTLVYQLGPELAMEDPSWIRPGKVAWDWWNASSLYGVEFESGLNTETYLHFIDFASENGIEYIILDEGWSDPADLSALNPEMDLDALLARGRDRGVGIILWVVWKSIEAEMETLFRQFSELGVVGVKVDFMQRDDQPMVDYYWDVAEAAARHRLLVDFHGAYKPAGLRRAFPNVLTREGVLGLEHSKWSEQPDPDHNLTLPFIRMVAGPMDYTPGAMRNAQRERFSPVFDRPMSLGTRVHQMAMYVIYESPLQMLADSPSNYEREGECLEFISSVPTVWDQTLVLSGQVGDWIAVARRRGTEWYIGAMTDWTPRELELDLSFLGEGRWESVTFSDGANAERNAEDYRRSMFPLDPTQPLTVHLASGGGWVGRFRSQEGG
jgi:alpha-glucosidase